ncbi:hypothetical protein BDQ12DRAFT_192270 [Crucibulum laeve]|uniref:Uncharacterized protein n=1 Tax=Crucibulum laeve TaxID=68775 RepID=A0A5C3MFK9_9AGAR|nr:hypothetical protein BDQ12DRAFT_192270 [Crucibulum laeve]
MLQLGKTEPVMSLLVLLLIVEIDRPRYALKIFEHQRFIRSSREFKIYSAEIVGLKIYQIALIRIIGRVGLNSNKSSNNIRFKFKRTHN